MAKSETFLRDAVRPTKAKPVVNLTYTDGFRFGFGAFIAVLLGILIVGGIALAAITLLHLH
jgi:gamma-glutamyl phosphate reductase